MIIKNLVKMKRSTATAERKKTIMETWEQYCENYRLKKKREQYQKNADDFLKRIGPFSKEAFDQVKLEYELFKEGAWQHNDETGKLEILEDSYNFKLHPCYRDYNMSCEYIDDKRPSVNRKMKIINIGGREVPVYYGSAPRFWKGKSEEWERWEEREKERLESMNGIQYPPGYFGPFRYHGDILAGQEIDPDKLMDIDTFFN